MSTWTEHLANAVAHLLDAGAQRSREAEEERAMRSETRRKRAKLKPTALDGAAPAKKPCCTTGRRVYHPEE